MSDFAQKETQGGRIYASRREDSHDMSTPAAQQHTRLAAPGSKEKRAAGAKLTLNFCLKVKIGFRSTNDLLINSQ
jgi:hypothetical protein